MRRFFVLSAAVAMFAALPCTPTMAAKTYNSSHSNTGSLYLTIKTSDGKQGQVNKLVTNGKTIYILLLNGKPAAPGKYTLANGKHITVVGPNGQINKNISDGAAKGQANE
jgi:hypothetical protein